MVMMYSGAVWDTNASFTERLLNTELVEGKRRGLLKIGSKTLICRVGTPWQYFMGRKPSGDRIKGDTGGRGGAEGSIGPNWPPSSPTSVIFISLHSPGLNKLGNLTLGVSVRVENYFCVTPRRSGSRSCGEWARGTSSFHSFPQNLCRLRAH